MKKIIRTITYFSNDLSPKPLQKLEVLATKLMNHDYEIQTQRICVANTSFQELESYYPQENLFLSRGTLSREEAQNSLEEFLQADRSFFNLELYDAIREEDVAFLFEILKRRPEKAFHFAFTFSNAMGSPFLPSSAYPGRDGFAIGLQSTNLARSCMSVDEWLQNMRLVWNELVVLLGDDSEFLGIDSSIAPLYEKDESFLYFMKKCYGSLANATVSDGFVKLSHGIKENNPKPIGLCGLMFPCLEDFELAREYTRGEFTIERNLFLSLHSGLGIDTYPLGMDEKPEHVLQVLKLLQRLSFKYQKPLSARFICDGKTKIGETSDFQNKYLLDALIHPLLP